MRNARTMAPAILLLAIAALSLMACKSNNKNNPIPTTQQTASQPTAEATPPSGAPPEATQPGGRTASVDSCTLVTGDDAQTALGEAVVEATPSSAQALQMAPGLTFTASSCEYASTTTAHSVHIDLWTASNADQLRQAIRQIVCGSKEAISGLGDVACWYNAGHTEIQVSKGSAFVDITINMPADATQALQTLARDAIGRLP